MARRCASCGFAVCALSQRPKPGYKCASLAFLACFSLQICPVPSARRRQPDLSTRHCQSCEPDRSIEAARVTRSALSHRLRDIERRIGSLLFHRTTRRLVLSQGRRSPARSCGAYSGPGPGSERSAAGIPRLDIRSSTDHRSASAGAGMARPAGRPLPGKVSRNHDRGSAYRPAG